MSNHEYNNGVEAPGATRLLEDPGERQALTVRRETDVRTAMARGLKEYLETLSTDLEGRALAFKKVLQTWAEPEDPGEYPSAVIWTSEPGEYDDASFTPGLSRENKVPGLEDTYLMMPCEFTQTFFVEVWSTGRVERMVLNAMLEDAFFPVEWMYGFRLELPHYHNMHADFEPISVMYMDNENDARRRFRKLVVAINGRMPLVRIKSEVLKPSIRSRLEVATGPASVATGLAGPDGNEGQREPCP